MKEEERPRNQIGVDMAQDKHNKIAQSSIKQSVRTRNIAQGPHKARAKCMSHQDKAVATS